jgi:hypothetical protein
MVEILLAVLLRKYPISPPAARFPRFAIRLSVVVCVRVFQEDHTKAACLMSSEIRPAAQNRRTGCTRNPIEAVGGRL